MSEKEIIEVLCELGLSKREADVYLALSRRGIQGVNSLSTVLKMDRVQAYRILKSLQEKGVVETSLETPTRFSAISLEALIDSYIKIKKSEVDGLEVKKNELIAYWKSFSVKTPEYPIAKFRVLRERKKIYMEILSMIQNSKKEVLELTTSSGVIQEDIAGIFDTMIDLAQKNPNSQFRILTTISKENYEVIEEMIKKIATKSLNILWRHLDLGSKNYPRFIMKDENEAILYVTSRDELSLSQEDTGLWIRSGVFTSTLRESFMEMWRNAIQADERIEELKTGKPVEETAIIKDAQESQIKLRKILDAAEKEIIAITSSDGINRFLENNLLKSLSEKGLNFRIMAPIDLDNLEAACKLSEISEVRHVPISYLMMLMVDDRHLFMFRMPTAEADVKTVFYLENMFYTNDSRYVERVSEMLNDIWKRGLDIRELSTGSGMKTQTVHVSSSEAVSKVVDCMLVNNVNSVIVTENDNPIGIINENDILRKILKQRRNPEKISAKEIMSLPIVKIESAEPLMGSLKIMRRMKMQRLAVFRNGKLVGMLTQKPLWKKD